MQIFAFYTVLFVSVFNSKKCHLFSDAEIGKDVTKHFVVGDFAYNLGEIVDGGAQVFAHEVAAEAEFEALLYFLDVGKGEGEGFVVAHIGNDDIATGD